VILFYALGVTRNSLRNLMLNVIFTGGKNIELKHQRNADAFFDCLRTVNGEMKSPQFFMPTMSDHVSEIH
jgi:hypothetical protein